LFSWFKGQPLRCSWRSGLFLPMAWCGCVYELGRLCFEVMPGGERPEPLPHSRGNNCLEGVAEPSGAIPSGVFRPLLFVTSALPSSAEECKHRRSQELAISCCQFGIDGHGFENITPGHSGSSQVGRDSPSGIRLSPGLAKQASMFKKMRFPCPPDVRHVLACVIASKSSEGVCLASLP
jgi:hypothetical protein